MPSHIDLVNFAKQVKKLNSENGHRWSIEHVPDSLRAYVLLRPVGSADEYCLRIDFGEDLSSGPARVAFCHPQTHEEGRAEDWPRGLTQFFKAPPEHGPGWMCNPWTREGRFHHAEWRNFPWSVQRALWNTITPIQDILDAPGNYTGRAA
jgi:hypothetical protein